MLSLVWKIARHAWPEIKLLPLRAAVALGSAGLGQPPRPDQLFRAYFIVLPIGLLTWWAIPQMTLVMSPSIDAWAVTADPGPIHRGDLVSFMTSGPVVVQVLEGEDAVKRNRDIMGATNPANAEPGTIRK